MTNVYGGEFSSLLLPLDNFDRNDDGRANFNYWNNDDENKHGYNVPSENDDINEPDDNSNHNRYPYHRPNNNDEDNDGDPNKYPYQRPNNNEDDNDDDDDKPFPIYKRKHRKDVNIGMAYDPNHILDQ